MPERECKYYIFTKGLCGVYKVIWEYAPLFLYKRTHVLFEYDCASDVCRFQRYCVELIR